MSRSVFLRLMLWFALLQFNNSWKTSVVDAYEGQEQQNDGTNEVGSITSRRVIQPHMIMDAMEDGSRQQQQQHGERPQLQQHQLVHPPLRYNHQRRVRRDDPTTIVARSLQDTTTSDDEDGDDSTSSSSSSSSDSDDVPTLSPSPTVVPTVSMAPSITASPTSDHKIQKKDSKSSSGSSSSKKESKSSSSSGSGKSSKKESSSSKGSSDDDEESGDSDEDASPSISPAPTQTASPTYKKSSSSSSKKEKSGKTSGKSSSSSSKKSSGKSGDDDSDDDGTTGAPSPPSSSSKSSKSNKSSKKSSSPKSSSPKSSSKKSGSSKKGSDKTPTLPPVEPFVPQVVWRANVADAANTGELFFDRTTNFAWYTYNADVGGSDSSVSTARDADRSLSSSESVRDEDDRVRSGDAKQLEDGEDDTLQILYGKICAIDTSNGRVLTPCQEIRPVIGTSSSTEIQAISACYDNDGAIVSFAVAAHDETKFLQFTTIAGSRLIVYNVASNGNAQRQAPVDVRYDGWTSIYGEPAVSGRPTFSKDCGTVYSTWITNPKFGGTIAVSTAVSTSDGAELWRSTVEEGQGGTLNRRFVGFGLSKNGKTLYSATNLPGSELSSDDSSVSSLVRTMGVYAVEASTGQVLQQYTYDDDGEHNAYANLVVDDDDNTFHIDRVFGLVKFDGSDLSKGPVWKSASLAASIEISSSDEIPIRRLSGAYDKSILSHRVLRPNNNAETNNVFTPAAAYQPALDGSQKTVYAFDRIGSTENRSESVGGDITAQTTNTGSAVWTVSLDLAPSFGVTDDTLWGPSKVSRGEAGVYTAAGPTVLCQDSQDGAVLWTYEIGENESMDTTVSKVTVMSDENVLVASSGTIDMLWTTPDRQPTRPPSQMPGPTLPPNNGPTSPIPGTPTRPPINVPTSPTQLPDETPTLTPISVPPSSAITIQCHLYTLVSMQIGMILIAVLM